MDGNFERFLLSSSPIQFLLVKQTLFCYKIPLISCFSSRYSSNYYSYYYSYSLPLSSVESCPFSIDSPSPSQITDSSIYSIYLIYCSCYSYIINSCTFSIFLPFPFPSSPAMKSLAPLFLESFLPYFIWAFHLSWNFLRVQLYVLNSQGQYCFMQEHLTVAIWGLPFHVAWRVILGYLLVQYEWDYIYFSYLIFGNTSFTSAFSFISISSSPNGKLISLANLPSPSFYGEQNSCTQPSTLYNLSPYTQWFSVFGIGVFSMIVNPLPDLHEYSAIRVWPDLSLGEGLVEGGWMRDLQIEGEVTSIIIDSKVRCVNFIQKSSARLLSRKIKIRAYLFINCRFGLFQRQMTITLLQLKQEYI